MPSLVIPLLTRSFYLCYNTLIAQTNQQSTKKERNSITMNESTDSPFSSRAAMPDPATSPLPTPPTKKHTSRLSLPLLFICFLVPITALVCGTILALHSHNGFALFAFLIAIFTFPQYTTHIKD